MISTVVVRNATAQDRSWGGITILAGQSYTVQAVDRVRLLSDPIYLTALTAGNAVIGNGSIEFNAEDGLKYLVGTALDYFFNNQTNGFVSKNVQAAIEESRGGGTGKLISFTTVRAGSAGNSFTYFGDSGVTTNDSPFLVPENARIIGITATSNSASRSYDVNLNISNFNAGNTVSRTIAYQVRNTRNFVRMDWTGVLPEYNVNAGDKIAVYCRTQGAAPSDLVVTVYLQFTSGVNVSLSENPASGITVTIGPITINIG